MSITVSVWIKAEMCVVLTCGKVFFNRKWDSILAPSPHPSSPLKALWRVDWKGYEKSFGTSQAAGEGVDEESDI